MRAAPIIEEVDGLPSILYIKLKSWDRYDEYARTLEYNESGFLRSLFDRGRFSFDPQFSTAKLDYSFSEHRNLSELGRFIVQEHEGVIRNFVDRSS